MQQAWRANLIYAYMMFIDVICIQYTLWGIQHDNGTLPLSSKNGHVPLPDWIAKQSNIYRTMIWLGIGLYT
jgi:hypothetical protein